MKRIAVASSIILLSGCVSNDVWVKPGATQGQFAQEKYACMQQSQHTVSSAYVNKYGGSSESFVTTNNPLFSSCMNARGWYLQDKRQLEAGNQATEAGWAALTEEASQLCAREDLQAHYRKSPCKPQDATLEQMADKSRISPSEKEALSKVRSDRTAIAKRASDYLRQHVQQNGIALALIGERMESESDKIAVEFYEGRITRGEYNKKRREIAQQMAEQWRVASAN
jgi:hypothetical protein